MMRTPLHPHNLEIINPSDAYINGEWQCDNCDRLYHRENEPHHCHECMFDFCDTCISPKIHPSHPTHGLYFAKMANVYPNYSGEFKCDACGKNKGARTNDLYAYHCFEDQFDLCTSCFQGQKYAIHVHPLTLSNVTNIYDNVPGRWICDSCRRSGSVIGTDFSWHCSVCEFDCCEQCLLPVRIRNHEHALEITDPRNVYFEYNGGWKCDLCQTEFEPGENHQNKPYHCFSCQFDACRLCVQQILLLESDQGYDVAGPPTSAFSYRRSSLQNCSHTHAPPLEIEVDDDETPVENLDDSQKCIVCINRPKNATIVHGSTGHVCCCLSCAYTLQRRGDNCPICRAPIDRVIKHFTS